MADISDRYARGLYDLGIRRSDRVAIWLPNCLEFAVAYWGNAKVGAASIPINTQFKAEEAHFVLADSEAKAIVAHANYKPILDQLWPRLPELNAAVYVEGHAPSEAEGFAARPGPEGAAGVLGFEQLLEQGARSLAHRGKAGLTFKYRVDAKKPAVFLYTSGTTGRPKGVMLSHHNIVSDAAAAAKVLPTGPQQIMLCCLPLFHSFGQLVFLPFAVTGGAAVVILERFIPQNVLQALATYECTFFAGVPSMYAVLLQVPKRQRPPVPKLTCCISGGAPMPLEIMETFEREYGVVISEGDGPTECSPVVSVNPLDGRPRKPGSVGIPLPGVKVKIFDDKDQELPPNEIGEIVVKGQNVMLGYHNLPDDTREAMRGGWFHTGDLGKIDEDGYIWIVDRKKDMIIVGGQNVYPREIEELLYSHPKVAEAAVIGISDDLRGEAPKAIVVLKPGQQATPAEIMAYVRPRLANYKLPRATEFRESLPKSATGKILKRELIDPRKLPSLVSLRVRQLADEVYPPPAGKSRRTRSRTRLPRPPASQ
jgi:long-chain acyl-CoA synthetase